MGGALVTCPAEGDSFRGASRSGWGPRQPAAAAAAAAGH